MHVQNVMAFSPFGYFPLKNLASKIDSCIAVLLFLILAKLLIAMPTNSK